MSSTAFVSFLVAYAVCWIIAKGTTTPDEVAEFLEKADSESENGSTTDWYEVGKDEDTNPIVPFPASIQTSFFVSAGTMYFRHFITISQLSGTVFEKAL
ncbi:toxin-antitoxin system, toxin component, HicA domain protein [Ostertagia ostertagi]